MLMLQLLNNHTMISKYLPFVLIISCLTGCARPDPYAFYKGRQNFLNQNYGIARVQLLGPAETGNAEAQYALGYMYLNGLGTPADQQEALRWITVSAKSGYPPAQQALQVIKPEMDALSVYDNYAIPSASSSKHLKRKKRWWHPLREEKRRTEVIEIPAQEEVITKASQDLPTNVSPVSKTIQMGEAEGNHEQTLMSKPSSSYTIQVIGTHDLKSVQHFIRTHHLEKNTRYYTTQRDGKSWYNLLYGVYPSSSEATKRLNQLPDHLKSFNPWVKPMKQVHREISGNKK